jgi:antitoxin (DNA-binding transcriptional repressor) of toxin-antitoxin stability system
MVRVSVEDIQQDFSTYLQRVEGGETLIIEREGEPVAEIKPALVPTDTLRPFGLCAGEFMAPDDFDAPLPDDFLNTFEDA